MDIDKCVALLKAVDTGSLSAAGEALGYSPSGVARMVSALEGELGFRLLDRNPKGVKLTADGQLMLHALRELARWSEQARQISAEIRGLSIGDISIGTYYSVAACWLPGIIKAFQKDYPGITIHTLEGGSSDLTGWLYGKTVDFCFFSECPTGCQWIPLKRDPLVVWLPKEHPKADLPAYPLKDLQNEAFIKTLPGKKTDLERLLESEGLTPEIKFTTGDSYSTYVMVEAGLGVSLNNELMAKNWTGDVVIRPFDPPRYITLGIAVPSLKEASPAARRFIEYAKRLVGGSELN